jgi:ATP-dependent RNA helicase RhlE
MNSNKVTEFADIITNKALLSYLESVSISVPTQVQIDCIPKLAGAGHYTIQSRTGTGKTLGYLLPIIDKLKALESKALETQESAVAGSPKVLIVAPTRELAMQIFNVAKDISHFSKLRIRKLVGGDKGKSLKSMFTTPIDILVATPERCLRSLKNKELSKDNLKYLVLDEADQLLEPSFKKTIKDISFFLKDQDMQLFLVSASRPAKFTETINDFFPSFDLQIIGAGEENILNTQVSTFNIVLEEADKFNYINDFIRQQKNKNGVIFMGNKARSKRLFEELKEKGHKKLYLIHKDLEIKERVTVFDTFSKKGGILIATDIFARGIDIPHLQWVLNFDLPSEPYFYLHRSGRVGRSGRTGEVFNFVTSKDTERQERINQALSNQGRSDLKIVATAAIGQASRRNKLLKTVKKTK